MENLNEYTENMKSTKNIPGTSAAFPKGHRGGRIIPLFCAK